MKPFLPPHRAGNRPSFVWGGLLLFLCCFASALTAQSANDCSILGYWENENGQQVFDFNDEQVLSMLPNDGACDVHTYGSYTVNGDTLTLYAEQIPRDTTHFHLEFVDGCDSLLLAPYRNGQLVNTISYGRRAGGLCDRAIAHVYTPPFFQNPRNMPFIRIGFFVGYAFILGWWVFFAFVRRDPVRRFRVWVGLLVYVLAVYLLTGYLAVYAIFLFHLGTTVARLVVRWTPEPLYQVVLYGTFVGLVTCLEYGARFGFNSAINSYFTITPLLLNVVGLGLVFRFFQMVFHNSREQARYGKAVDDINLRYHAPLTMTSTASVTQRQFNAGFWYSVVALMAPQLLLFFFRAEIFGTLTSIF